MWFRRSRRTESLEILFSVLALAGGALLSPHVGERAEPPPADAPDLVGLWEWHLADSGAASRVDGVLFELRLDESGRLEGSLLLEDELDAPVDRVSFADGRLCLVAGSGHYVGRLSDDGREISGTLRHPGGRDTASLRRVPPRHPLPRRGAAST